MIRLAPLFAALLLPLPALAQTVPAATPAPAAAPATGDKVPEAVTATSSKGYSIRMPSARGWTPLKNVPGTDLAFVNQTVNGLRPTVTVVVQDIPADLKPTLADVRDINERKMPAYVPKLKMLGEKTVRISGLPAILWSYSGDGDGGPVRWTQLFTLRGTRLYTVTLMTPTGTPADVVETGRSILNSFALTAK